MSQKKAKATRKEEATEAVANGDLNTLIAQGVALGGAIQGLKMAKDKVDEIVTDLTVQQRETTRKVDLIQRAAEGKTDAAA